MLRLRWVWALIPLLACGGPEPEGEGSSSSSTGASPSSPSTSGSDASLDTSTSGDTDESTTAEDDTGTETTEDDTGTETGEPLSCAVVDVEGTCGPVTRCPRGSTPFQAQCEGPPSEQCCVPVSPPCSVDGAPGLCLSLDSCPAGLETTPGLCPGAADIQCCTDPTTACDPRAMPLPNEGLEEEPWDPACPGGMVSAGAVCIDRFEAALLVLDDMGEVTGHHSPYFNPGSTRVRAVSLRGSIPQGYISQTQAEAACGEANKRLCTDAEWLRACQGVGTTTYPWGNVAEPGRCNDARDAHPVVEYFGTNEEWIWSELDHPCISQLPDSLHVTGRHETCISEDNVLDMVGNLHEWTADPAGSFRGGFYTDTTINGPGCLYLTTAHNVSHWDYSTGFRCCAEQR